MKIKEAEYKDEQVTRKRRVKDAIYGCDCCEKEFDGDNTLTIRAFFSDTSLIKNYDGERDCVNYDFCSWECLLKKLPELKSDYFIDIPYLSCDGEGINSFDGFLKAIKNYE